ncbi:competence/damage-inducible protein A [Streptococcus pacificus]|uniref:Putative competence-damage inducible protein n=1 Tax=Streptococcus pacificus TaxID=2740577 RepID=A0ABS0ZJU6_9STRE|nr:competence/damage-inducible protein A [Streptococcus pacificus]MBJ8326290.1 competence/damage-inducible protein A [Streptococcus pacificus]
MKAEIIAVGTEILTGQIVNTNAQFLSEKFAENGIDVYFQTAVGDNEERLLSVLSIAKQRSDIVVLCGGLGPTEDDLTKQVLAKFLEKPLIVDQEAMTKLDAFFATRPTASRTANNDRQAQIILGAKAIKNPTGLAVGSMIEVDKTTYVVLPGPPSELKPMVTQFLLPLLKNEAILYSRVLRFFGIGESRLVTELSDIIANQTDPTVAPYAKIGEVTLRLSTKAKTEEEANKKLDKLEHEILNTSTLKNYHYGYGDDNSLAEVVFEMLRQKKKTITAAESLTAGLFQSQIADFPGSSSVFKGGFVTYSLEEKSRMLGISLEDLKDNGVVSAFTAEKMAEQSRRLTDSDFGVSLTGVAGPETLEGQPVGTVYIGLATEDAVFSQKIMIGGRSRSDIRHIATMYSFNILRQALLKL